jgi:aspartyl-tRNA(Asn)/glutamyl-tRNA(Gln) amidotransferase subunit A
MRETDRGGSPLAPEVTGCSALQLAGLIQSGASDPVAVAEATLAGIQSGNEPGLFTLVTADRARSEARMSAERHREGRPRSLLDGVPVAWKELFDFAGIVTTAGSRVLASSAPARQDAAVVQRLCAAGMVSVGRLGMTEFAFSGLGLNPHFGTPRNPHGGKEPRIPGGSSSGSAVAVARGLVPVAIGTDTGGSVRIPAAFNGIVGYKATFGRYPMDGVFPLASSLDSLGGFARTVADAVSVDAAMCGRVASDVVRQAPGKARIIVPTNVVFDDAEPAVVARFEAALDRLSAAGAKVERRPIPAFDAVIALGARYGTLVAAEAYALHAERLNGPESAGMDRRVAARMRGGAAISMPDFVAIRDARTRLIDEARRDLGPDTLVAHPTVAHVAPLMQPLEADDDLYVKTNARTLRNTMLGNFLAWCGISLPCGCDEQGLPVGFLLSAAGGADAALLGSALEIEEIVRAG